MRKLKNPFKEDNILGDLNVPRLVCIHLIGEKHTHIHHLIVGAFFIIIGLVVMEGAHSIQYALISRGFEGVSNVVQAVGATPIIEAVIRNSKS